MDVVLLILMIASSAAAVTFGIVAWRVVREERARSAARVAGLSDAIDGDAGRPDGRPLPDAPLLTFAGAGRQAGPSSTTLIRAAVVGVMAIALVVYAAMGGEQREETAPGARTVAASGAAPLELVSMRHARNGDTLTVTGLVRNPPAGAEARRVTAVVFAFDRTGSFVASSRAPLDFVVLQPDDESPFVVTLPNAGEVARYRVSFRTEEGLLRHLDRRASRMQLAGNQ